ncbi:MAG TPA: hypothetical protein P5154_06050, partial [Candidatus Izemoplasmatales bacterium]|nr:hypothetical protein [Candidatus Izemoplasmatales bacterium]
LFLTPACVAFFSRWENSDSDVLRTDRNGTISLFYFPWGRRALVMRFREGGLFDHELARMIGFF